MKTEELKALGLTEEQIAAVMKQNGLDVEAEKAKTTQADNNRAELEKQLKERDQQLTDLKKSPPADAAALEKQIAELQAANTAATQAHEKALAQAKLDSAVEVALMGAKAKNSKAVKALLDQEKIKLEGEKLTGLDDQLEALRKDADYLFEPVQQAQQMKGFVPTGTPPAGGAPGAQGALESQVGSIFGLQGGVTNA